MVNGEWSMVNGEYSRLTIRASFMTGIFVLFILPEKTKGTYKSNYNRKNILGYS